MQLPGNGRYHRFGSRGESAMIGQVLCLNAERAGVSQKEKRRAVFGLNGSLIGYVAPGKDEFIFDVLDENYDFLANVRSESAAEHFLKEREFHRHQFGTKRRR